MQARTVEVAEQCCNGAGDDCSSGAPASCDVACAEKLLSFWEECRDALGAETSVVELALQACQETIVASEGLSETLAQQLMLSCDDLGSSEDCIPACTESLHGDLLLANINGEGEPPFAAANARHADLFAWLPQSTCECLCCPLLRRFQVQL